jgi:thioredoxin-like negative regulator of GroEL
LATRGAERSVRQYHAYNGDMATMRCPRCGFDQPGNAECARCAIVIARYHGRPMTPRPGVRSQPVDTRRKPSPSRSHAFWLIALALAFAFALVFATFWSFLSPTKQSQETRTAPEARTPPAAVVLQPARTPSLAERKAVYNNPSPTPLKPAACPFLAMNAPPLSSKPPFPGYWFEGASELERAKQMYERSGVPLFIYFFTDWCPFCRDLERNLLNSVDVERYLRDTAIRARVNPEASDENRRLAAGFGVARFPTLFLVLPGEKPRRLSTRISDGGESRLMNDAEFVGQMSKRIAAYIRQRLSESEERRRAGDPSTAIDILDAVAALNPEEPRIYLQRAAANTARGDRDRALEDLRRAYDLASDEIRTFRQADALLTSESRWGEIAACWSAYIERQPNDAQAHLERGGALYRQGDREGARRDVEAACRFGESRACDLVERLGG